MRNNDKEQQRNYEKLPGNKTKFPANNENGHHTNKMHFHIKARDLIVIIVIAFIFVVGHFGGNDTDDPIPTTDSTKNPITSISFEYNTEDTVELDPDDYEYVYFRFNTGRYTFDDIQLVSTNPDVCKLEFDDEAPSSTLDCKISALSAGESVVYIQTPDGAVKSPEIKVTVLPLTIERIHFDQGVNNKLDMYIGETIEDKISVSANADITSEHITLVSSNPDVVQFEYIDLKDGAFFTYINYKIHALSEGECVLYAQSADGEIRSEEIQIIVTSQPETSETTRPQIPIETTEHEETYILNIKTEKFHDPSCHYADRISSENKEVYNGTREDLINDGYDPCGHCDP